MYGINCHHIQHFNGTNTLCLFTCFIYLFTYVVCVCVLVPVAQKCQAVQMEVIVTNSASIIFEIGFLCCSLLYKTDCKCTGMLSVLLYHRNRSTQNMCLGLCEI